MMPVDSSPLTASIAERLRRVQERVRAACLRAGRDPEEVTVIGVTKTFPVSVVEAAYRAGLTHFGENRVQELVEKALALPGKLHGGEVTWHLIGHLQRNKAKRAVAYADFFHALDSLRLAEAIEKRAAQQGRVMPCLVEVNVSGEESKFGVSPEALYPFLDALADFEHLEVLGLMTIAAYLPDPEEVRPQFRRLRMLFEGYVDSENPRVKMKYLSMGMSHDFEVAIEEGATHVRIGRAIFGERTG